jgi:hypothetical protein
MKKILTLGIVLPLLVNLACTPLESRMEMHTASLTANELEISTIVKTVDGKNGNEIVVENHSPILSQWTMGGVTSTRAYDILKATRTGAQTIHFKGALGGGKYVEKDLTVQVDTISTIPAAIAKRLCIGTEGAPDHFGSTFDASLIGFSNEKNIVTVWNTNPVLTDWTCGTATLNTNTGIMKMPGAGEYPISATITKADGSMETIDLGTVVVKDYDLPQIVLNLVGEHGEKTWVFAGESYYGVGGYQETINQWPLDAYLGYFTGYFGMTGEESGSMTLNVLGEMSVAPTGREGTFSYDFPDEHGWHVGTLTTSIPIVGGIAFDINAQQPSYTPTEYFIVSCEPDKLVLGAPCAPGDDLHDWTMCTFWVFKAVADSPTAGLPQVVKNLVGEDGTKTWKFVESGYYGVGGYQETVNQWPIDGNLAYFTSYFGMTGEEAGTITFNVDGSMSVTPTEREGTFTYDFPDEHPWHIGTLSCSIPLLAGIAFDINTQQPSYTPTEYIVVSCEADKLVIGAPCAEGDDLHDWTMCTFWVFQPVNE